MSHVVRVRSIICCLAVHKLMISAADVARKLDLSPSVVSKSAVRGRMDSLLKRIQNDRHGHYKEGKQGKTVSLSESKAKAMGIRAFVMKLLLKNETLLLFHFPKRSFRSLSMGFCDPSSSVPSGT